MKGDLEGEGKEISEVEKKRILDLVEDLKKFRVTKEQKVKMVHKMVSLREVKAIKGAEAVKAVKVAEVNEVIK